MKAPLSYYGSKGRLAPLIASLMPPHRIYFEPYCGSAAVLFAKPPVRKEVLNDLDSNVTTFFRVLRDQPEDLQAALALTPYARDEYRSASIEAELDLDDVERARRFFVRATQSFNSAGVGRWHQFSWAASVRRGSARSKSNVAVVDRLLDVAHRLRGVIVDNRPALELLELYDAPDAVFYVDPPYLSSTRSSLDARASDYRFDMADEDAHRELGARLHDLEATVILSGYSSDLYAELYGDWPLLEISVSRPSANRRGEESKKATEVLWMNREFAQGSLWQEPEEAA